jgi:thiamine biosynthesis lipoprotein
VSDVFVHTTSMMGTVVSIEVVGHGETVERRSERANAVARAVNWIQHVEDCCSRFDPCSELRRISERIGAPVKVSATTLEVVRFAMALAEETGGAFDPTIGHSMVERGFDRHYRSGEVVAAVHALPASYREVELDVSASTITLHRELQLDLGAVAKGFAIDLATRELSPFENFAVNAGGDMFLAGRNRNDTEWSIGIKHPRDEGALIDMVHVSNVAVCTSGDYERRSPRDDRGHHLLDPRSGTCANSAASATVIAPLAMVADGLATAAFVLGPTHGLELLDKHGVQGLVVTPSLERFATSEWPGE